jgi:phage terminase Nu1 subunit (DNA packaging protein)
MAEPVVIAFPTRRDEAGVVWEPWVDEDGVARHFGVSGRTVRRWRAEGMPSRLIGGSRRYKIAACEQWHRERGER